MKKCREAFFLIELLVVIAIISILAAMLLTVLGRAKMKAQGIYCINNLKQLQLAVIMYTGDNQEKFPESSSVGSSLNAWVAGFMSWDTVQPNEENTNTILLKNAEIGPYVAKN